MTWLLLRVCLFHLSRVARSNTTLKVSVSSGRMTHAREGYTKQRGIVRWLEVWVGAEGTKSVYKKENKPKKPTYLTNKQYSTLILIKKENTYRQKKILRTKTCDQISITNKNKSKKFKF